MSTTQCSEGASGAPARRQLATDSSYGSHQIRVRSLVFRVSTRPSSASVSSRRWTHRWERSTSSVISRAVVAGPSLSRRASSSSSSLTLFGRPPAPIHSFHRSCVITWVGRIERQIHVMTHIRWNRGSQSRRALFGAPARWRRAGLASRYRMEAMQANAPRSLESTGSIDTDQHEQTYLNHFGSVTASRRRLGELTREDRADGGNQEGNQ